ncbi:MAG: tyrosine-type recombinase/integrase [Stenotrophomonas sp.]
MPLTDAAIRRAKPAEKPQKLTDGGGLYLYITTAGARSWRWKYRIAGKEKLLSIGLYPDVSLARAREARDDARRLLARGVDPGAQKRAAALAHAELGSDNFEAIANEWMATRPWVLGYKTKVEAWLKNDVHPWIGSRSVSDLTAPDFLRVARRIEDRGAIESAHRIMQNCGQIMRYAIATGRAERNPVADLKGALAPPKEAHHAAITDPAQLGGLLRSIETYGGSLITCMALRLAPLVFLRPGELRHAEWDEFDLDAAVWTIPASKMKMRVAHLVPLSRQAVQILKQIEPITGRHKWVFSGARDSKRPMSENAVTAALRNMGYDRTMMTGHGFRATARTILDEVLGFRPDIIEHQLAHAVKDPNGRAYNRTSHLQERVRMMQVWADYLDGLRDGNVVQLRTG